MRGRAGSLLFAAARISWQTVGPLHQSRCGAGVLYREVLRAALHGELRPPDLLYRSLASSAARRPSHARAHHRSAQRRTGTDREELVTSTKYLVPGISCAHAVCGLSF